jgi:hypothetical protein
LSLPSDIGSRIGNACYQEADDTGIDPMFISMFIEDVISLWGKLVLLVTKEPTVKKNISEMDEEELKRAIEMQEKFV